jgi:hypothetical protein
VTCQRSLESVLPPAKMLRRPTCEGAGRGRGVLSLDLVCDTARLPDSTVTTSDVTERRGEDLAMTGASDLLLAAETSSVGDVDAGEEKSLDRGAKMFLEACKDGESS